MRFFIPVVALAALAAAAPIADVADANDVTDIADVDDFTDVDAPELNEFEERAAFKGGYCGLHAKLSYAYSSLSSAEIEVKDGAGKSLGKVSGTSTSVFNKGGLPKPLTINPNKGYSNPYISFIYGDGQWTTSSPQCKVGKPDNKLGVAYIQLDCGFSC